ncbi:radical SAM protein [candidate division KSB1 bacterium]|nr:MAG: radical SAM protein [candidate division KSB1 bacterium]
MQYIYGPVPSRRLGFSLGVDLVPLKVCTLDCIYCQVGRTTRKTLERHEYVSTQAVLTELEQNLKSSGRIDYITFSGSGEPTLHAKIGEMIHRLKQMTDIPVAVITNGTLLYREDVQHDLMEAEVILPSLDAASEQSFWKINRPHRQLDIRNIITGMEQFRRKYKGQIWLEIMLLKNVNDNLEELQKLKEAVARIQPDKVHLNTAVRPPGSPSTQIKVEALTQQELEKIRLQFGDKCEIIVSFQAAEQQAYDTDVEAAILALTARRPVTIEDMANSLSRHRDEILKYVTSLLSEGRLLKRQHDKHHFYTNAEANATKRSL